MRAVKKSDRTDIAAYQREMTSLLRGRLAAWQWRVLALMTAIATVSFITHGYLGIPFWMVICMGVIALSFAPARHPVRFLQYIAKKSPTKPMMHAGRVSPIGVIELDYGGKRYSAVQLTNFGKFRFESEQHALRAIATVYGGTIQAVITNGLPRSQWHEGQGAPELFYLIMVEGNDGDRLVNAVQQVKLEVVLPPRMATFDVSAGHNITHAHLFAELMPFDYPDWFVDELRTMPVDKTIVVSLRAERNGDQILYHSSLDLFLFAPSRIETRFYLRFVLSKARQNWVKLRVLPNPRRLPFASAFPNTPLGHEISFEMHPTHGPVLLLEPKA